VAYTHAEKLTASDDIAKQTMQTVSQMFSGGKAKRQSRAQALAAAEQARQSSLASTIEAGSADDTLTTATAANEFQPVIKYQHICLQLDDLLVLIDPVNYQATDSGNHAVLDIDGSDQKNILRFFYDLHSLTFKRKPQSVHWQNFIWPPQQGLPSHIQQADMAYSMQQTFLQHLAKKQRFTHILIFSDGYVEAVLGSDNVTQAQHGSLSTVQNVPVLHVAALQQYWRSSAAKLKLWQGLQTLFKADN
jgi:hypothetical protein